MEVVQNASTGTITVLFNGEVLPCTQDIGEPNLRFATTLKDVRVLHLKNIAKRLKSNPSTITHPHLGKCKTQTALELRFARRILSAGRQLTQMACAFVSLKI